MPLYTYIHRGSYGGMPCAKLPAGRATFEVVQPIKDATLTRCPECGRSVERVVPTGTSFRFKNGAPTPRFHR